MCHKVFYGINNFFTVITNLITSAVFENLMQARRNSGIYTWRISRRLWILPDGWCHLVESRIILVFSS